MPTYEYYDEEDEENSEHYDGPPIREDCGACHGPDECDCCSHCRAADCASCGYRVACGYVTPPLPGAPHVRRRYTRPPWSGARGHRDNMPIDFKGDGTIPGAPDGTKMFYGMEFEITTDEYLPMYLAEYLADGIAWTKPDGSVRGMELVTQPMAYDWAMMNFPWQMLAQLKDEGCTIIPSTNGIHVHASRAGFGTRRKSAIAHQYEWTKFVYRNQPDIERMARRQTGRWAGFSETVRSSQYDYARAQKTPGLRYNGRDNPASYALEDEYNRRRSELQQWWDNNRSSRRQMDYDRRDADIQVWYYRGRARIARTLLDDRVIREARYQAINSTNAATLEARIFASTLDPVTAQSCLGLIAGTIEYTRQLTARDVLKSDGWQWKGFRGWLAEQPLYGAVRFADKNLKPGNTSALIIP